jgi:hypothetical protein
MVEARGVYRILVGRPEGKRPLGRPRRRWEDNIKLDLRETGVDWGELDSSAQDRVQWRTFVNTVMNLRFHKESRLLYDKMSNYRLFNEYPAPWTK